MDNPDFFKSTASPVKQAADDSSEVHRKETMAITDDIETPMIYLPDYDFKPTKMIRVNEFC